MATLPPLSKTRMSGLYWGTALGNIWFVTTVTGVFFGLNIPGHEITSQMTLVWLTIMSCYTGNKSVHQIRENRWGQSLGWSTIIFAFIIFTLNIFFLPNTKVPEALYWGLEGVILNLGGWEFAKTRQPRKNGNGNQNGNQNNASPTP